MNEADFPVKAHILSPVCPYQTKRYQTTLTVSIYDTPHDGVMIEHNYVIQSNKNEGKTHCQRDFKHIHHVLIIDLIQ